MFIPKYVYYFVWMMVRFYDIIKIYIAFQLAIKTMFL